VVGGKMKDYDTIKECPLCEIVDSLTDEEQIILYYCATRRKHKIDAITIETWSNGDELIPFDASDAFDLLQRSGHGDIVTENGKPIFVLDIDLYKIMVASDFDMTALQAVFDKRISASVDRFSKLLENGKFGIVDKLFIFYIIEERVSSFGDRWMANGQIKKIVDWETRNSLDGSLSGNYRACLEVFIANELVYPSSYTSYGNAREYTLNTSVRNLLIENNTTLKKELLKVKEQHII
jgi:hypothetical protein